MPESVNEFAIFEEVIKTFPFEPRGPGYSLLFLTDLPDIQVCMGHVQISAENDRFGLFQSLKMSKHVFVKFLGAILDAREANARVR